MSKPNSNKALQKSKGLAIKGLKAWIKALEIAEGSRISKQKYRYEIAEDGTTARIYTAADGTTVEGCERSLADWAKIGAPARHALIGLRYTKEQLDREGPRVLYTLDVITQEAHISRDGQVLTDKPTTIESWAQLGREIEKREFESKRAAEEWNNKDAVQHVLENMVRWGIIRQMPDGSPQSQAS